MTTWVIMGVFLAGFSSILTGLNFIVTIHKMRAPGLTWFRLPLFIWSHYATSLIQVLGTPVIAITMVLVLVEKLSAWASSIPNWAAIRCCFSIFFVLLAPRRLHHDFAWHGGRFRNHRLLFAQTHLRL